jgi:hypothetical protein
MKITQLRQLIREEVSNIRTYMKGTEEHKRAEWKGRFGSMDGFDKAYPQYSKDKVAKTGKYEIRYITDDFGTNIYSIFLDGLEFGDEYDGEGGVLPTDRRISIKNIEKLLKKFKNSIKESVNEGKMSDINLIAKEAANFNDFVKQFYIEYSNFPKTVESTQWLKDIYTGKTKMESVTTNVNENCGCGGAKTTNPYSLSEFVIKENDYKLGDVEYTAKNMGPVDIMKLAFEYHQTPITKLAGKNIDHRIRVSRDLGRLIGKSHINPNEKGKEPAWLLYPYKGKLVSTEEYKELYKGLFDKLKRLVKYIKNADPATRQDAAAAKAVARADIKKEF